ncbi:MAG TPA: prepilin-type N-terminal cleavage/methylation domain-containing protein [Longimicrobiaceae bacterium]|nr:prepilin-type N-terminal cleavage/methylation domain-containing protein [Longimicrobiaceae bacterium]
MSTAPAERRDAGFTLVEVLAAMVILAFGLLALEGLGIGAARSVTLAARQSEYAVAASSALETALGQLRAGTVPPQWCKSGVFPGGGSLSLAVDLSRPELPRVTVRAIPGDGVGGATPSTFEISGAAYVPPGGLTGNATGAPCS